MRLILILVVLLLLSLKAIAKNDSPEVIEISLSVVKISVLPLKISKPSSVTEPHIAILYKMKENIIRRELSFVPKKKWMKWS